LDYLREKYRNFEIEEINNQFTNANLVDTRIITKYARAYLNSYFNKVNVVNGKITDILRKIWGLQGEEETKDRSNHIHHCIDAIVVACVEKGTANKISELYHNYEFDYFRGNGNPRIHAKEPMNNFVERLKNLHKEVLIYHKQTDRIKPLLINAQKENAKKLNLRGKLNSQNPYAHILKNDELIFAQRKPITSISSNDFDNIIDEGIKKRILDFASEVGLEAFVKECNKTGYMILPKYYNDEKNKDIGEMIIKRLRLKSSKSNLKDYKEIRKIDQKQSKDKRYVHKHDYYFDKDSYTNYEARIYGDLIPNDKRKFVNREYKVINHHNIVKNIFVEESTNSILQLHKDDMFLVFDLKPSDEINWGDKFDLQNRLFKIVKFDENGIIVLIRHNYAGGSVGTATAIKTENDLSDSSQVVLRRSPSTLRIIPVKVDALGKIDTKFSKNFINLNS
jgi:CRISPR-associated endonuclease Csn1